MMKNTLLLLLVMLATSTLFAQRGNNQIGIGIEAGFPTGDFSDYKTGVGGTAKLMIGAGYHGQVTFSTGYTSFKWKGSNDDLKIKENVIPLLVGYRYNLAIIYVEPKIGLGIYDAKYKSDNADTKSETSDAGFTFGLSAGVQVSYFDFSVKYQAGYPGGGTVGYFGIGAGYNFALRRPHH